MPELTITIPDDVYSKLTNYCGGNVYPEDAVLIMIKSFIRQDEESKKKEEQKGGN